MRWNAFFVCAWTAVLAWAGLQSALPASWWFDAGEVSVSDTMQGEPCAPMTFDRVIERPFFAAWTVTIMRQNAKGGFVTYRTFSGSNDYRPENELPDDLNLCWWTWTDTLDLQPGNYRIHTLWKLQVDGGTREVRRTSNTFKVQAAI